jgi:hypothetical protein
MTDSFVDKVFGDSVERCGFEEHPADLLAQGSDAPTFSPAHFGTKVAFQGIVEWEKQGKVTPGQLSGQ